MSENVAQVRGTSQSFKNDKGGAVTKNYPLIGIVKNNIDPQRSGRVQVFIEDFGSADSNDGSSWLTVSYMSPFFGSTSPSGGDSAGHGSYTNNPHAYGWWGSPPDIGSKVICIFVNGDVNFGYYIGGIPESGFNHMVPAIGSSTNITLNSGEAGSYGGATRLPVSEVNKGNSKLAGSSSPSNEARPVHSYLAAILNKQGLIRDPDRGTIGSSAVRESPSRVMGFSSPGRPIYEGGFTDETIKDASKTAGADSMKIAGRRGGHSVVLDDGDQSGADQLLRLRTAGGHQIMMNDSAEALFIIHSNGQSWVELGKEGTVDIYSTNSFNVRTQGDLNLHADNNVNIHAKKNLNLHAENIFVESEKDTAIKSGAKFSQHTSAEHTVKVDAAMAFASGGAAGFTSSAATHINGSKVNLNSGSSPLTPASVQSLPTIAHTDTLYDGSKGYAAAPGHLKSITSRAPAHMPWSDLGVGVDVKVNLSAEAAFPAAPSPAVQQANNGSASAPPNPTNPSLSSTVPNPQAASPSLDKNVTSALVSQAATNAATGAAANAVKTGQSVLNPVTSGGAPSVQSFSIGDSFTSALSSSTSGPTAVVGKFALNAKQLVDAGTLKPGADAIIEKALAAGKSIQNAIPTNLFTGKDGITSVSDFTKNIGAQVNAQVSLFSNAEDGLKKAGLITGAESPTQTGGLIMTAAAAGIGTAVDYAKGLMSSGTAGLGSGLSSAASGLGLKLPAGLPNLSNLTSGSPGDLMSAGKFASGLADKVTGGLSSLSSLIPANPLDSLKGTAAGAFASITSKFKTLKSGVPVNLNVINAETAAETAKAGGFDPIKAVKGMLPDPSGLGKLPGGLDSVKNMVSSLNPSSMLDKLPSLDKLKTAATGAIASATSGVTSAVGSISKLATGATSGSTSGGSISAAISKGVDGAVSSATSAISKGVDGALASATSAIGNAKGGLMAAATAGLGAGELSKLNASISAIASGGPAGIKLPTMAEATSSFDAIKDKSKALLGDPKIPPLSFGAMKFKLPSLPDAKKFDELKAKLSTEEDNFFATRKAYWDAKSQFGPDSPEAKAAEQTYKTSTQTLETIRKDMSGLA